MDLWLSLGNELISNIILSKFAQGTTGATIMKKKQKGAFGRSIQPILDSMIKEHNRRVLLLQEFMQLINEGDLIEQLNKLEQADRIAESYFRRFLEGNLFNFDERVELRLFRESLITGGILSDKIALDLVPKQSAVERDLIL